MDNNLFNWGTEDQESRRIAEQQEWNLIMEQARKLKTRHLAMERIKGNARGSTRGATRGTSAKGEGGGQREPNPD